MRFGKTGRSQTKVDVRRERDLRDSSGKIPWSRENKGKQRNTVQSIEGKTTEKRETTYGDCVGNGDEERRDASKRLCSSLADVGETSARGSSVGSVCGRKRREYKEMASQNTDAARR